jgi:hypothetical protein
MSMRQSTNRCCLFAICSAHPIMSHRAELPRDPGRFRADCHTSRIAIPQRLSLPLHQYDTIPWLQGRVGR